MQIHTLPSLPRVPSTIGVVGTSSFKEFDLHDVDVIMDVINLQIGGFLVVDPCPVSHLSTLARDSAARQEQGQHHQHPHHDCSTHYVNTTSESLLHRLARAVPPERRGCETIKGKKGLVNPQSITNADENIKAPSVSARR